MSENMPPLEPLASLLKQREAVLDILRRVLSVAHECQAFKGRIAHVTEDLLIEMEAALKGVSNEPGAGG